MPSITVGEGPAVRLAICDQTLSSILSDVEALLSELSSLRAATDRLVARDSDQRTLLAEKDLAIARLETERAEACRRADHASTSLDTARATREAGEERLASLEDELRGLHDLLSGRERLLSDVQRELDGARDELARRDSLRSIGALALVAEVPTERAGLAGHVSFAGFEDGYRLTASDEHCPPPGGVMEIHGRQFVVGRVGRSPLPGDDRPCAFLLPR